MDNRALITGATSGIGAEFARQLGERGTDLVLVARDAARLGSLAVELRNAHGVDVEVLAADLLSRDGLAGVVSRLEQQTQPVTLLVNNAGFGLNTSFHDSDIEEEARLVRIHVDVPMRLMHAALVRMAASGPQGAGGAIINVASVAAFTPRGTYAASKAWQVSFSRWANYEYRRSGVTVTAVCPGFVHTEFHARMGMSKEPYPGWMWLSTAQVVREGLAAAAAGRPVSIPSLRYKVVAAAARALPPAFVARLAARRGR